MSLDPWFPCFSGGTASQVLAVDVPHGTNHPHLNSGYARWIVEPVGAGRLCLFGHQMLKLKLKLMWMPVPVPVRALEIESVGLNGGTDLGRA